MRDLNHILDKNRRKNLNLFQLNLCLKKGMIIKMNNINDELPSDKEQQIQRGKRIKHIREKELHLTKTALAAKIGISSQFLGLIEEGNGNLVYRSLKKLRDISGHSADYILYGLDDTVIQKTSKYLEEYSEEDIKHAISTLQDLTLLIKKQS